jgi:transmembrane sensor
MKRPPLPPLSDSALHRVERGVFEALDARPLEAGPARAPRWRFVALAVTSAAAAGAIFVVRDGRRGEALPARAAQISTTTSGSHIAIAGATLDVAPQSAVSFGGGRDGALVVALERGTVTCEVAPRTNRAPFIVEAGETRVTVIGTRFSVHREGAHATVSVEHGLVEVADTNMTELVHAGERFRPGEPVTRAPLASEAPPPNAIAPAPVVAAATPVPPVTSTRPAHHRRLALAEVAAPGASADAPKPPEPTRAAADDARASPTASAPAVAQAADAGAPRRSVQVLFELAAQLEVRDPVAALRIYGELAGGDDGWAASALFASARLEAERGLAPQARALCDSYLQRFPRGPNADDARALLATSH